MIWDQSGVPSRCPEAQRFNTDSESIDSSLVATIDAGDIEQQQFYEIIEMECLVK